MIQEYLDKNNLGEYILNDFGNQAVFEKTIAKLLHYYMKEGLKLNEAHIQTKLKELPTFLKNNYSNLEDYLNKVNLMAQFIGINNEAHLSTFIGNNFFKFVAKEKAIFLDEQITVYQNLHENPYRTPSDSLIDEYALLFLKAPTLVWPIKALEDMVQIVDEEKEDPRKKREREDKERELKRQNEPLPSLNLLEKLEVAFNEAPPLIFKPEDFESTSNAQDEIKVYNPKTRQVTTKSLSNINQTQPLAETPELTSIDSPGERLLKKWGTLFDNAPPLVRIDIESLDETQSQNKLKSHQEETENTPLQINLKEYATIQQQITNFQVKKDPQGYQNWYQKLNTKYKITIKMFSLLHKEGQGSYIDWDSQLSSFSKQTGISMPILWKIYFEMKKYQEILPELQGYFKSLSGTNKGLYLSIINCLASNENLQFKKTSVQAVLLQIKEVSIRTDLVSKLNNLIDKMSM